MKQHVNQNLRHPISRRSFIQQSSLTAGLLAFGQLPLDVMANEKSGRGLTVLHTNDVHSRLDPFPMDGGQYQGLGGVVARHKLIKKIRSEAEQVLLLDAGDIFQGTPYFNFYKGEPEMKVMSMLGYECATLGNHDFDNGIDGLANQLINAEFPIVNCNYNFSGTSLEHKVLPYTIVRKGKLKIGIIGVGIELAGLVPEKLYAGIQYDDPVRCANEVAYRLHTHKRCDYIICLSHLGFSYNDAKISDQVLAKESEYINLILGGHTHTFLDEPYKTKNRKNQVVLVNQVGWAGIKLGRIDIYFDNKKDSDYVSNFTAIDVKETSV